MNREQNIELVEQLLEAVRTKDEEAFAAAYAPDATVRMAGVPRGLGGVLEGRDRIVENFHRQPRTSLDVRLIFGDHTHVCVVGKLTGVVTETQYWRGNGQPFATYECVVYRLVDGRIQEQTSYVNWLDAYVQAGLVDIASLLA